MSNAAIVASLSPEVLELLSRSYARPVEEIVERAARKRPASKPSKLAMVKAAKAEEPQAVSTEESRKPIVMIAFPPLGTYDARSFLVAMRRAHNRDEEIQAIAGYCGFDRYGDFGSQCLSAKMQAQREIHPAVALPAPVHTAIHTLRGFNLPAVPDEQAKRAGNLLAHERLAAEAIIEHETFAKDETLSPSDRHYHAQLALVEQGRLVQIRADLAVLGA